MKIHEKQCKTLKIIAKSVCHDFIQVALAAQLPVHPGRLCLELSRRCPYAEDLLQEPRSKPRDGSFRPLLALLKPEKPGQRAMK